MITRTVNVLVADQNGMTYADAIITAILSDIDIDPDFGYIVPEQETYRSDADGEVVMELWPNARGTKNTKYRITATTKQGKLIFDVWATVPDEDGSDLPDISEPVSCGGPACTVPGVDSDQGDIDAAIAEHEAKPNPHPQYASANDLASAITALQESTDPFDQYILKALKGAANGVAELDGNGRVPQSQLPAAALGGMVWMGGWDADTNVPELTSSTGTEGHFYNVTTAGTTDLDGISSWAVGDTVIFDGGTWKKIPAANLVTSVAGRTGAIVLAIADVVGLQSALNAKATLPTAGTKGSITVTVSGGQISGMAYVALSVGTAALANGGVTLAKMASLNANTIIGRLSSTGVPQALTAAQVRTLLNVADNATANDSDENLKNRANHTGEQAISTITGLQTALDAKGDVSSPGAQAARSVAVFADATGKQIAGTGVFIDTNNNLYGNGKRIVVFSGSSLMLTSDHAGCIIWCTYNTAPVTIFLPDNATSVLPVGFDATVVQANTMPVNIVTMGGGVLVSPVLPVSTTSRYSSVRVVKQNVNNWWADKAVGSGSSETIPIILNEEATLTEPGKYWLDFSDLAFDVTLPESVFPLSDFSFLIVGGDVESMVTKPKILRNGNKIAGEEEDLELDQNYASFRMRYAGDPDYGLIISR